jgi:hypothetical protein
MAMELAYKRFMDFASTAYKRSMARELNKMGKIYLFEFDFHARFCCRSLARSVARRFFPLPLCPFNGSFSLSFSNDLFMLLGDLYTVSLIYVGLRYEDLLISETPAAKEALSLASPDVVTGRMRRLKRASDLCFKAKTLQDYAPNMELEPFKMELSADIAKVEARNEEYELLDLYKK